MAHDRLFAIPGQAGALLGLGLQVAPAHERMFAPAPDGPHRIVDELLAEAQQVAEPTELERRGLQ